MQPTVTQKIDMLLMNLKVDIAKLVIQAYKDGQTDLIAELKKKAEKKIIT